MTSIITHTAVPITIAAVAGKRNVPRPLLLTGVAASLIPDLDTVGLMFGIPHGHFLGHRGLTHSPVFGLAVALLSLSAWRKLGPSRPAVFGMVFVSVLSHGLLDAITHGGIGVAFLSPFSDERFLFPCRPIPAAPLDLSRFLASQGAMMLLAEVAWVWVPCLIFVMFCRLLGHIKAAPDKPPKKTFFNPTLAWEARQRQRAGA